MEPKAIGTFERRGPYIFRTNARLQWGDSDNPLGIIIMLNPGSSRLNEPNAWKRFMETSLDSEVKNQELWMDSTMRVLKRIINLSYSRLNGYLEIRNLFNHRVDPPQRKPSIIKYKDLLIEERYRDVLHSSFNDLQTFPWVWLAWTVEKDVILDNRRQSILAQIPAGTKKLSLPSRQSKLSKHGDLYIRHPLEPRYDKGMIDQFKLYLRTV